MIRTENGKVKGENGKVNQRSTPEGAEVKTENGKLFFNGERGAVSGESHTSSDNSVSTAPALLPIEGANKVLGELTQSQFVPGEGKTFPATAPANCPPETGWTRSKATEGVDKNGK